MTAPTPVLLDADQAAHYANVQPATLRVWRHRYGLTRYGSARRSLYDLHELAEILATRGVGDLDS